MAEGSFEFAFDNQVFSDRILVLKASPESANLDQGEPSDKTRLLEDGRPSRKRPRSEYEESDDVPTQALVKVEEAIVKDEPPRVLKTLHVSSAILASKSTFFLKLFSNGMQESGSKEATLHVKAEDLGVVMDCLQFMYTGRLNASTPGDILKVLIMADSYEIKACVEHCSQQLVAFPLTLDNAVLYLTLPASVQQAEGIQGLLQAATKGLEDHFGDFNKVWDTQQLLDELMSLPAQAAEAVLQSDRVKAKSEISVFWTVCKWIKTQKQARTEVAHRLARTVRYAWIPARFFEAILATPTFEPQVLQELVTEGLLFKASPYSRQQELVQAATEHRRYVQRETPWLKIRSFEMDQPRMQMMVFLDLRLEDCLALSPNQHQRTESVRLGNRKFYLVVRHNVAGGMGCLALALQMRKDKDVDALPKGSKMIFEIFARQKPSLCYKSWRVTDTDIRGDSYQWGYNNVLGKTWEQAIRSDGEFFYNDVLYFRVDITLYD